MSREWNAQAASDVYSPVSGKVTEVNETLNDSPDLVRLTYFIHLISKGITPLLFNWLSGESIC